jgi:hypothetical protein
MLAGLATLAPALRHGVDLGTFDLLSRYGLAAHHGVIVHSSQRGDQIDEMIPWTNLAWSQVHGGHLPLWNQFNGLGLPLAFNWQAATFSLPALVSYAFPLHLAYTVQVFTTMAIAGTGVYLLGRALGLGVLASTLSATCFEIGGTFFGWLGWPHAGVASWGGWLLAAAVFVLRGRHRVRWVVLLAFVVAFMVYAGQPEVLFLMGSVGVVFVTVLLVRRANWAGSSGPIVRPVLDLGIAVVAGLALAAPLILPGLQLLGHSVRVGRASFEALPVHNLAYFIAQGFDGLPITGSQWFSTLAYGETAAYIGVIAVVLAVTAVARRWRRPEVMALTVVAVLAAALVFVPPVVYVMERLPAFNHLLWNSALLPLGLALAVLAGVGMDTVVRSYRERTVLAWAGGGFVVAMVVLLGIWAFGGGDLTARDAALRSHSLVWPTVETLAGLLVVGGLALVVRRTIPDTAHWGPRWSAGQWGGLVLLGVTTLFLVASGGQLWSSSSQYFPSSPAVVSLQKAVGSAVVGFGDRTCFVPPTFGILQEANIPPTLGILPQANIAYGVREFDSYDPITPESYFTSWFETTGQSASTLLPGPSAFCPAVTTASAARRYGVGFVLVAHGHPGPRGAVFDRVIANEDLYRIPGAAAATLSALSPSGQMPSANAPGQPAPVTHPGPAAWKLVTRATTPQVLRLRLTDVPGWHATIDGRPLALERFSGVMLEARIPPGRHTIELHYWPPAFTAGIVLALCSLFGLVLAVVIATIRRRRRLSFSSRLLPPDGDPDQAG